MKRPLELAHDFLAQVITKDDVVVDATMGNGHDTLFLAKLAKQVYAFDIQEQALEKTSQRLQEAGLTNVELLLQGHETVNQFVTEVKAAIFNLGYLPTADKSIITKPHTTIEALEKLCQMLVKGGRIAIMIYYGHEGGDIERDAVMDYVSQLPQQEYTAFAEHVHLARLGDFSGVGYGQASERAAIMGDTPRCQVYLKPPDGLVHAFDAVCSPLEHMLGTVFERPFANLGPPILGIAVHAFHLVATKEFVDSGGYFPAGYPALPLGRIPDSGPVIWPVAGCERETIKGFASDGSPVVVF